MRSSILRMVGGVVALVLGACRGDGAHAEGDAAEGTTTRAEATSSPQDDASSSGDPSSGGASTEGVTSTEGVASTGEEGGWSPFQCGSPSERLPRILELDPPLFTEGADPSGDASCRIVNPERGFYRTFDLQTANADILASYRAAGHSLVFGRILLSEYRTQALDDALLEQLRTGFEVVRAAGLQVIPRVYYAPDQGDPDAPLEWVLAHIDQLAPVFAEHADVIAVVQAGFIGAWGEWHGSTNGLDDDEPRAQILAALLEALPSSRMIQVRRPSFKENAYGGPLDANAANAGSDVARIGHHNDCFLASADDFGTYASMQERAYMEADAPFVPVGGETCAVNPPRSDCASALDEMALLHFSYLNAEYHSTVLDNWQSQGCYERIACQMGYRFAVRRVEWDPQSVSEGHLSVRVTVVNDGWAAPFNERPVRLVLTGPQTVAIDLELDARAWQPGVDQTICVSTPLPTDLAAGSYTLGLWLPHADDELQHTPAYAVRIANTQWDETTGVNLLPAELTVP